MFFSQGNLKVCSVYFFLYKTCKLIFALSSHFDQYIVFLVPDSCRATTRNLQYKPGRLKRLERRLFLLFLDNLTVGFFFQLYDIAE